MNHNFTRRAIAVLAILIALPAAAQQDDATTTTSTTAQTVPPASPGPQANTVPHPQPTTMTTSSGASVQMLSGGIGDDELAYIKSVQDQYTAKFLFSEANGVYVANVKVQITDKSGADVLSTSTKGPILLLTLPAGTYKVTATEDAATTSKKVKVSGKGLTSAHLIFPAKDPTSK